MSGIAQIKLLARYNQWMNEKLYDAAAVLPPGEAEADRQAFFGSLLGTLNHLVAADTIWLQRFAAHSRFAAGLAAVAALPAPTALDAPQCSSLAALRERRAWLDQHVLAWIERLDETDLDAVIEYRRMNGEANRRRLGMLLLHFFNHQTHHRGQATTLLFQAGIDPGVTDLLMLVPEADV